MTREEQWKREAERYVNGIPIFAEEGEGFSRTQMQQAYLAGAEPREKRIAELELEDKIKIIELEQQIEKMKCGQNCKHSYLYQEDRKCKFTYCDCINCKDKWELRR